MLTGGDRIHAQRKYGHPFSFNPICILVFSANEAPPSFDQTQAWFDSWLIIPMERRIGDEEMDPGLIEKLTVPSELEGLLGLV